MKKIILILNGLLLFFNAESQISYTVNINSSDLTISQIIARDSNIYTIVNITNLYSSAEPGNLLCLMNLYIFIYPTEKMWII